MQAQVGRSLAGARRVTLGDYFVTAFRLVTFLAMRSRVAQLRLVEAYAPDLPSAPQGHDLTHDAEGNLLRRGRPQIEAGRSENARNVIR